jgi:WD40 repeat protein
MDFTELYKSSNHLVQFSPNSQYLATAVEHRVVIRDADTLQILHLYNCSDAVEQLIWSPDAEFILCASYKKAAIQIWSVKDPEWTASIDEGISGLTAVIWSV